jgi:hypothetical protein
MEFLLEDRDRPLTGVGTRKLLNMLAPSWKLSRSMAEKDKAQHSSFNMARSLTLKIKYKKYNKIIKIDWHVILVLTITFLLGQI